MGNIVIDREKYEADTEYAVRVFWDKHSLEIDTDTRFQIESNLLIARALLLLTAAVRDGKK